MSNLKTGQKYWMFDFDARQKTWSMYQVVFVHYFRSAAMIGEWCVVEKPDGSSDDDVRDDELFENREDAIKALIECAKKIRESQHSDIIYHTKEIARDWGAIDYCTDIIEKLEKETT